MRPSDREITDLARQMADLGRGERTRVYRMSWWSERMLEWAMARPEFKTQLFRFVDVFPATTSDADVLAHLDQYFDRQSTPGLMRVALATAHRLPGGRRLAASVARRNIERMADQFIVGSDPTMAAVGLKELWGRGVASTVDLLGEKTVVASDADRYASRVQEMLTTLTTAASAWPAQPHAESDDLGPLARVNISVKPTALATHFHPLSRKEGLDSAIARLRPVVDRARELGAFIHLDMEHYEVKDLSLELVRRLAAEFPDVGLGVVIQAYLRDAHDDLKDLIAVSGGRDQPLTVRLVKGAYWDTESIEADAAGWASPVWQAKDQTDANYERCTRLLLDHHGSVRAAFGSHNLRSLAHAVVYARARGIPDDGYEVQMLYGMAEPLQSAIRQLGLRLRVYSPVGELVPGMAYLVRRLLENTSNESFVRARFAEGRELKELLAPPTADLDDTFEQEREVLVDPPVAAPYRPEPVAEWRHIGSRTRMVAAVEHAPESFPLDVPAVIGGIDHMPDTVRESIDPGQHERVVAVAAECGVREAGAAVDAASTALEHWQWADARQRADILRRAGAWMRRNRFRLAALAVFEAGKPWAEADADVAEAIDFCRYYASEMERLAEGGRVQSPAGERNAMGYRSRGVAAVISPWNFPFAIVTGMTAAALVAGNTVVLKPAEQTPACALAVVRAFEAAGLPRGCLNLTPGAGEVVGAHLVTHPDVATIAFTGSMEVGLEINRTAAVTRPGQRHVKRVIAEMGGKNAMIVDADADPDVAIPAAVKSAFGFAGQKCSALSRLIVVDPLYPSFLDRFSEAASQILVGPASDPATQMGPLIDEDAHQKVTGWQQRALGGEFGPVTVGPQDLPTGGWFVPPVVVSEVDPDSDLAGTEVFGPLLAVIRAGSFAEAVEIANHSDYALTAGVFSRSPSHIDRAARLVRAGNIYVNRAITGAVVGRQPFGGFGLSGVGAKAGGPDYLLQFMDPVAVSENTVRQGFAPDLVVGTE